MVEAQDRASLRSTLQRDGYVQELLVPSSSEWIGSQMSAGAHGRMPAWMERSAVAVQAAMRCKAHFWRAIT